MAIEEEWCEQHEQKRMNKQDRRKLDDLLTATGTDAGTVLVYRPLLVCLAG